MPDAEKSQNQLHRQVSDKANYSLLATEEGMLLLLADGTIQACNADSDRILGLTAEQLVGQNLLDLKWQFIHEDGSPLLSETHPAIAAQKTGNVVCGFYKPNGELIWLLLSSQPLFQDGESTPYAIVTTFSDITASKDAQLQENSSCEPNTQPVAEDTREQKIEEVESPPELGLFKIIEDSNLSFWLQQEAESIIPPAPCPRSATLTTSLPPAPCLLPLPPASYPLPPASCPLPPLLIFRHCAIVNVCFNKLLGLFRGYFTYMT